MNQPDADPSLKRSPPPLRRLLGRLVLALLLPSTLAMASVLWLGARKEEDRVLYQLASITANAALPLGQHISAARAAMEELSRQAAALHGHDDLQLQQLMQSAVTLNELSGLYLVGRDGAVLTNTFAPIGTPLPPVREPELLGSLQTGLTRITDLFIGPISTKQLIGITVPVVVQGEVRYTLNAGVTLDRLHTWLSRQAVPEGWALFVTDRQGAILAHVGAGSYVPGSRVPDALLSVLGQPPTLVHRHLNLNDKAAFTMSRTSGALGWTTVVQAPRSTVLLALGRDMLLALLALGSVALIGLSQAGAIARRIASSIEHLGAQPSASDSDPSEVLRLPPNFGVHSSAPDNAGRGDER